MVIAVGALALMDACMKILAPHYSPMQIASMRGLSALPIVIPWIAFSGSVALGYLAAKLSEGPAKTSVAPCAPPPSPSRLATESDRPNNSSSDHWGELRGAALTLLVGGMRDLAARGLPLVLDYLGSQRKEPSLRKPMIVPTAATLPLSSKTMPGAGRPLTRQIV